MNLRPALSFLLVSAAASTAAAQVPITVSPSGTSSPPPSAPVEPAAPAAPAGGASPGGAPAGNSSAPAGAGADTSGWFYGDNNDNGEVEPTTELHAGPVPELHVVRNGDTLWDLCSYYFNDPWQWPKIWSFNPSISNPHWIYPGDLVRMLPHGLETAGQLPADPETGKPTTAAAPAPGDRRLGSEPVPAKSMDVALRQLAFVDNDALRSPIRIAGAVEDKALLSRGDSVYLSYSKDRPPKVGQRLSIYTIGHEAKHPGSGKTVGAYVRILGQLEVQAVKQDKRARAVVLDSNLEIERGAHAGPIATQWKTVPPTRAQVDAKGTIVAMLDHDVLAGPGEVVFIDLGDKSGLEVGNRMYTVRRGDALDTSGRVDATVGQNDQRFPARALGEVLIVEVGRNLSVGLVTLAVQEMVPGDQVIMQKAE